MYREKAKSISDAEARETIQSFIYKNSLTSFFSNLGHKKIKQLKCNYKNSSKKNFITTLDLCCGLGHNCDFLNDFEKYTGIDYNKNFIDYARKKYTDYSFIHMNVLEYNSTLDNKFDIVTAIQALEHFCSKDLELMFLNILKYLKNDGIFIYIIPLDSSILINLGRWLTTKRYMDSKFKGFDYMKWLKENEHINDYENILPTVAKFFSITRQLFLPINLKIINLNIYNLGLCKPFVCMN